MASLPLGSVGFGCGGVGMSDDGLGASSLGGSLGLGPAVPKASLDAPSLGSQPLGQPFRPPLGSGIGGGGDGLGGGLGGFDLSLTPSPPKGGGADLSKGGMDLSPNKLSPNPLGQELMLPKALAEPTPEVAAGGGGGNKLKALGGGSGAVGRGNGKDPIACLGLAHLVDSLKVTHHKTEGRKEDGNPEEVLR